MKKEKTKRMKDRERKKERDKKRKNKGNVFWGSEREKDFTILPKNLASALVILMILTSQEES